MVISYGQVPLMHWLVDGDICQHRVGSEQQGVIGELLQTHEIDCAMQKQGSRTPVSATLRSVCRKAQTMESMTSFSCPGDMVNRVPKQALVMDRNRLKNCSRCSG